MTLNVSLPRKYKTSQRGVLEMVFFLNASKTRALNLPQPFAGPVNCTSLSFSSSLNILGVVFQPTVKWSEHIRLTVSKASRKIYLLKQLRKIKNVRVTKYDLMAVYKQTILSVLEYNCSLFVGLGKRDSNLLERFLRRCHKIICGVNCELDCFPSLSERRESKALKVFHSSFCPDSPPDDLARTSWPIVLAIVVIAYMLILIFLKRHRRNLRSIPYASVFF